MPREVFRASWIRSSSRADVAAASEVRGSVPEMVVEVIHRLAGRSGQIGAKRLSARLRALEVTLRAPRQPLDGWWGEIAVLQQEVKILKAEVARKLRELQEA